MNWTRISTVGNGSTATVSLATATASDDIFAAKSAELSISSPLQREQSILSKLDSPYVVKYKGFDITKELNNKLYYNLFMEYLPRGSLSDEIRRRGGKLDESTIRLYTWEILQGLEYLHANGIVHCDIKSTNILMGKENVKISDLGCSKLVFGVKDSLVFCGTPMYMSPEVVLGHSQGFESDIWSLGCTVIEMATGKNPWPEVLDPISALYRIGFSGESPEFPSLLSQEGKDFLGFCLKRNPKERLTAKELLKHPFFDGLVGFGKERSSNSDIVKEVSPKSVFDQSVWDSFDALLTSSQDQDQDGENSSLDSHVDERIERLIGSFGDSQSGSLASSSGSAWTSDDEDWITIRSNNESDVISSLSLESFDVNNTISSVISGDRKRGFAIAFDECVESHVPRNLRFKERNENFRSLQYLLFSPLNPIFLIYSSLYFCLYFHMFISPLRSLISLDKR